MKQNARTRILMLREEMWVSIRKTACCSLYFYYYMHFTH